jgi:hypothetical protein
MIDGRVLSHLLYSSSVTIYAELSAAGTCTLGLYDQVWHELSTQICTQATWL